jgi:hypothetical protein
MRTKAKIFIGLVCICAHAHACLERHRFVIRRKIQNHVRLWCIIFVKTVFVVYTDVEFAEENLISSAYYIF